MPPAVQMTPCSVLRHEAETSIKHMACAWCVRVHAKLEDRPPASATSSKTSQAETCEATGIPPSLPMPHSWADVLDQLQRQSARRFARYPSHSDFPKPHALPKLRAGGKMNPRTCARAGGKANILAELLSSGIASIGLQATPEEPQTPCIQQ